MESQRSVKLGAQAAKHPKGFQIREAVLDYEDVVCLPRDDEIDRMHYIFHSRRLYA